MADDYRSPRPYVRSRHIANPYTQLPERAFWAPAVARRDALDIDQLWQPSSRIRPDLKVVTFGSCFAQHFSRALVARGFNWFDAEPAPAGLGAEDAQEFGYGVFSARTANIYTTSLFLQWVEWALGKRTPPPINWSAGDRVVDPFRPTIEPSGFASVEEMLAARAGTIRSFRRAVLESDLIVFTLGLTESWFQASPWWKSSGSYEYPLCPGTAGGEYDAAKHRFVNQTYDQVHRSLSRAIALIRGARAKPPRFLLTVSPVPLVASNSGNHVLVATSHSKAILRAVAGNLAKPGSGIDYFPSYEIISSHPYRARFFAPNLRAVLPEGVDHVMDQFFQGIGFDNVAAAHHPKPEKGLPEMTDEDVLCEEEMLAAFGPRGETE